MVNFMGRRLFCGILGRYGGLLVESWEVLSPRVEQLKLSNTKAQILLHDSTTHNGLHVTQTTMWYIRSYHRTHALVLTRLTLLQLTACLLDIYHCPANEMGSTTVPCEKMEPLFFLDYSANMYSRKT